MNKSVVKKLVKAKLLEYDALKEVLEEHMPESIKEKAKDLEKEVMGIAKEIVWEHIMDKNYEQSETAEENDLSDEGMHHKTQATNQSKVQKVKVQFGEE